MANLRPESTLSARQRFAMLLILVLALASFCVVLWKSRRQQPLTREEQVTLTEFQTIPPASAAPGDTTAGKSVKSGKRDSAPKKKKGRSKKSAKEKAPAPPPRDITSETVSPR